MNENFYDKYEADIEKQGLESYIEDEKERIMLKWRSEKTKKKVSENKNENM